MNQACSVRGLLAHRVVVCRGPSTSARKIASSIAVTILLFCSCFDMTSMAGTRGSEAVSVDVVLLNAPTADTPLVASVRFHIPDGLHVYYAKDHFFRIEERSSQNLGPPRFTFPPSRSIADALAEKPGATVEVFVGDVNVRIERNATGKDGKPWSYQGVVGFQACSEDTCFMPQEVPFTLSGIIGRTSIEPEPLSRPTKKDGEANGRENWQESARGFRTTGQSSGYMPKRKFLAFLDRVESGRSGPEESPLLSRLRGHGMAWIVLIILLWGLALNLTPCVLPMIPVNLAIIGAGAGAGSRGRGFLLGTVYGVAIAFVYGLLGLLVLLTGTTFGAVNASPWFNLSIAVLFVVLALAMFDVFIIDFSRFGAGLGGRGKSGSIGLALFMGGVSALLAGACVAPAVIAVLVLSAKLYATGISAGLALPFVLGLGMALPWPFAGAGISLLPRPGRWMTYVRNALGVLILLLAGYYAWTGIQLLGTRGAASETESPTRPVEETGGWLTSLEEALLASKTTDRPLFIDFWATWCKNCKAMDKTTFRDPDVRDRLARYIRLKFQAERPNDPATRAVLKHFAVQGLPTYLILTPPAPVATPNQ